MVDSLSCRACGVALPDRIAVCPSCGGLSGLGRSRAWIVPAVLVVVAALGLTMIVLTRRPLVDPALAKVVEAYPGISRLSSDWSRTDMTGFIDNNGEVTVDVTVRIRARDPSNLNNVVAEVRSGPHRRIAPGDSRKIPVKVTVVPNVRWEMEIIELGPSAR